MASTQGSRASDSRLTPGASLFLDVVRLAAAVVVALGHLTQGEFSSGWRDVTEYAVESVMAFFLLSGFVIRYVTVTRAEDLRGYLADRASRIYSVLLPALAFTLLADRAVSGLSHHSYPTDLGGTAHLLGVVLANLSFTSLAWHQNLSPALNSPMWSLSFECFFYLLYGLFFYLAGWRRWLWLLIVAIAAGPEILCLLPVWVGGCALYAAFLRLRTIRPRARLVALGGAAALACLGLWTPVRSRIVTLRDSSAALFHHGGAASSSSPHTLWLRALLPHIGHGSVVSLKLYPWAVVLFVAMLLGLLVCDRVPIAAKGRLRRTVAFLAEATFPLYLFHLPLFFLVVAAVGHPLHSNAAKLTLLAATLALSVAMGHVFNLFKLTIRGWLHPK